MITSIYDKSVDIAVFLINLHNYLGRVWLGVIAFGKRKCLNFGGNS